MTDAAQWRAYAGARSDILKHRQQSLAILAGLNLKPIPLRFPTNHIETHRVPKLDDWALIDTTQNYGCPLLGDMLDLDCDVRPLGDPEDPASYTPAYYATAPLVARVFTEAIEAAGIPKVLAFGRDSMGGYGHTIVLVPRSKDEQRMVEALHMAKYVEVPGLGVRVRIEVRRKAAKAESPKNWTLPGSTYRRRDGAGFDLIQWGRLFPNLKDGMTFPNALAPVEPYRLRLGFYIAFMTLMTWDRCADKGARHETFFHVTGAIAHDVQAGRILEEDAEHVVNFMIEQHSDDEPKDRLAMLSSSLLRMKKGEAVTGYRKLQDYLGDDNGKAWVNALRRMMQGDPDGIMKLFDIVVRINKGLITDNCYIDLSAKARGYVEMSKNAMIQRFSNKPEYPPVVGKDGKPVEAIRIVLHSERLRTFDEAIALPGAKFGSLFWSDPDKGGRYTEITDANPVPGGEPVFINVAPEFAVEPYTDADKPPEGICGEAQKLWTRFRNHLVSGSEEGGMKLDQGIAWKAQCPTEKQQVGYAISGGSLIGKSMLFEMVLPAIFGEELIGTATVENLESEHRFGGLYRYLFYYIDECKLSQLKRETQESLKNLMRSSRLRINEKYGKDHTVSNRAIPYFLSNDTNPKIMVDGKPDRALIVIRGDSQESLGLSRTGWEAQQARIDAEFQEFRVALERKEIRRALLTYFCRIKLRRDIFMRNEVDASSDDLFDALDVMVKCVVDAITDGYWMPPFTRGKRGPSIEDPFTLEFIGKALTMRARLTYGMYRQKEGSRNAVSSLISKAFMSQARRDRGKGRQEDESAFLGACRYFHEGKADWMYYLRQRRGELLHILRERRGLILEPAYTLAQDGERGEREEGPTKAEMAASFNFVPEQSNIHDLGSGLAW
jgi:hypothetical protein